MRAFAEPKLRTGIMPAPGANSRFTVGSVWCGVGSCFSEELLSLLADCGFQVCLNPGGIVYNSHSLNRIIDRAVTENYFRAEDFFEHDGLWRCWELHGRFSAPEPEDAVRKINSSLETFRQQLKIAAAVVLTPSSSVVYRLKENGDIVANCHKVNNNCFSRGLLTVEENREYLRAAVRGITAFNPDCRIIFSLSPVRHYPGDLVLNARSKANLLSAIRDVCDEFNADCEYFPACEIMQDELRDYRFYKPDMLHPSGQAVELILGRFVKTFFTPEALEFMNERRAEARTRNHRSRN
ncbi:MAG: GSCFA domain-containing protein [Victivallales bacterium]|nr:GSCFA domain-containing protein [Victivallales bacterium]